MQSMTDDLSHDEALSYRVAAHNLLDLGLRHLGIEIDTKLSRKKNWILWLMLVVKVSFFFSNATLIAYLTLFTFILKC